MRAANIVYVYLAYNESQEIVKGKLEASTDEQASEMLAYAGYRVVNLKQLAQFPIASKLKLGISRVKPTEIILFYHQLGLLLDTGMNIAAALEILEEQASNRMLKRALGKIISDLRSGSPLSVAMNKYPAIFSPIHTQSLKVGEESGNLETMLKEVTEHLEREVKTTKSVKNALSYPVFAFVIAIAVVGVMVGFVLPAFSKLYSSLGVKLPALTSLVISGGEKLQMFGPYLLLVLAIAGIAGYVYIRTPKGRYKWDKLSLTFPIVGRINHLKQLARLSRSSSLLFRAGLPLTEILPLVVEGSNRIIAEALSEVRRNMINGEGLHRPMSRNKIFLSMLVQMVKVGEETGSLDNTLLSVARSYEAEAEDRTRSLIGLIQPAMIIVIGVIVAILALSLVSAMYSIYNQI